MSIPVAYLCWGCGSSVVSQEETDLPLPARDQWNVCPDCQRGLNSHQQPDKNVTAIVRPLTNIYEGKNETLPIRTKVKTREQPNAK